jgi:hypothetical protein
MQSPSTQESVHSHTPESNPYPIMRTSQQNQAVYGWRENLRPLKHEQPELVGYVFDSELLREGSD